MRTEHPGRGVTIKRDSFDVPHVFGKTETDVFYGAGWAAAEDRGLLMELARYPGRLACLDAPGFNAFAVALSGKQFKPSQQAEDRIAKQISLADHRGRDGARRSSPTSTRTSRASTRSGRRRACRSHRGRAIDVIATTCLLGARFGAGGGDEARRSEFLSALQAKLGAAKGPSVFNDLRQQNVPGADDAYEGVPVRPADRRCARPRQRRRRRRERAAAARRSARCRTPCSSRRSARRPVTRSWSPGRSSGTSIPSSSGRSTWRAAASRCAAARSSGIPNVLIGRGPDYGWSFTSSQSDNIDTFAETLCGDDHHYLYKGVCTRDDALRRRRAP